MKTHMLAETVTGKVKDAAAAGAGKFDAEEVARGLGWFSIALGAAEVFAAGSLARWLGVRRRQGVLRLFGMREIGAGIGILSQPRPTAPWLWARVAGDALDLAALGIALASPRTNRGAVEVALAAVIGVTALDIVCARQLDCR